MNIGSRLFLMFVFLMHTYVMGLAQEERMQPLTQPLVAILFVHQDGSVYWQNFSDPETTLMKKEVQGSFLWYEKNGIGYLIIEPTVLSKMDQLSKELDSLTANDPNRPKTMKRGDSFTPSESHIAKSREIHIRIESVCEQAIKDGYSIPKSRPTTTQAH